MFVVPKVSILFYWWWPRIHADAAAVLLLTVHVLRASWTSHEPELKLTTNPEKTGFRERSSAFDFKAVLDDFVRFLDRQKRAEENSAVDVSGTNHEGGGLRGDLCSTPVVVSVVALAS